MGSHRAASWSYVGGPMVRVGANAQGLSTPQDACTSQVKRQLSLLTQGQYKSKDH